MIPARIPEHENRRLLALRDLELLDTPAEERFDRVTRMASHVFGVPISLVTLVDRDRQWFKSCVGLGVSETDRASSFCAHAILEPVTFIVPDTARDERFADNALVTGPPYIRFYAGHPLTAATGERIGTLCIIDTEPRELGEEDRQRLQDLAGWAEAELNRTDQGLLITRLRLSEERLWTTVEAIAEGIVSFGVDGRVRAANSAAERIFGTASGGLVDRHVDALVDGVTFAAMRPALGLDGGDGAMLGRRAQLTGVRTDGTRFPLEAAISQTRFDDQPVFVAVGGDTTERVDADRRLRASERRSRAIFESASVGIALTDADSAAILDVNPAFCRMLRATREQLRDTGYRPIVHPDTDPEVLREILAWHAAGSEGTLRRTLLCRRFDGSSFWAKLTASGVIRDDGPSPYVVGILEDVTERREHERMKDEFISVVGHELRTPLTSIRGALGLISGGVMGELPPDAAEMVDVALSNTERLGRLVNDILDVERIDAGHIELDRRPVSSRELVEQSIPVVRSMADAAGVTLRVEGEAVAVLADTDRIVQTLVNLLGNAIKFSPEGGEIVVRLGRDAGEGTFAVCDDGRGIPPDELDRIFERFRQVDATDAREKGGTGLGLAIAQRIVEGHDGQIWAESPPGGGCVMHFTLPMDAVQPGAAA